MGSVAQYKLLAKIVSLMGISFMLFTAIRYIVMALFAVTLADEFTIGLGHVSINCDSPKYVFYVIGLGGYFIPYVIAYNSFFRLDQLRNKGGWTYLINLCSGLMLCRAFIVILYLIAGFTANLFGLDYFVKPPVEFYISGLVGLNKWIFLIVLSIIGSINMRIMIKLRYFDFSIRGSQ